MKIGPHRLISNVVAAPMAGVTDRPFRQLCREWGAGMAVCEMIAANPALREQRKTLKRMDHVGESSPVVVQIVGADPGMMAEAARFNVSRGADIIDVNMGCPAKKVCRKLAGSALLGDEGLVREILSEVVRAIDVPVTLKMRTGTDPGHRNGVAIAELAQDAGVSAVAVHGRTRACKFGGEAEYETIGRIKQSVTIPVIANGDIDCPEKAAHVLEITGADAIMLGRAAQGRPWLFREIVEYVDNGKRFYAHVESQRETMLSHLRHLYEFHGPFTGVRIARKHISWYTRAHQGGNCLWQRIRKVEVPELQLEMVDEHFSTMAAAA